MSAIPHVHHRRHYVTPNPAENFQQDTWGTEVALFKAESATDAMTAFYATIINGTSTIDANWIASHPAGLRKSKDPNQIGITNPEAVSNQVGLLFSSVMIRAKKA